MAPSAERSVTERTRTTAIAFTTTSGAATQSRRRCSQPQSLDALLPQVNPPDRAAARDLGGVRDVATVWRDRVAPDHRGIVAGQVYWLFPFAKWHEPYVGLGPRCAIPKDRHGPAVWQPL